MYVGTVALPRPVIGLMCLCWSGLSFAHHSRVDFDTSSVVEVEGILVDVSWGNPHPTFAVLAEDQRWEIEGSAIYVIERSGITSDAFPVGQNVRVAGYQSRVQPFAMYITNMLLPGGDELLLLPSGERRWSDDYAGGEWVNEAVATNSRSLFRTWSTESYDVFIQASLGIEVELTDEAKAKMADSPRFDPCVPQGMPSMMVNPLPMDFVDRGDHIDLQLASFAVLRTIDMTENPDPDAVPATKLGYSAGRWVGDTLEVTTTRVSWPYFDDAGTPQTENVSIHETFAPSDDGARLDYTMIVTDPESFAEPFTLSWYWVDIGEQMFLHDTCPDAGATPAPH